jgi:hypothetical protein
MNVSNPCALFVYRNFKAAENPQCHIGLGVNALHTIKVLRRAGIRADAVGAWTPDDVRARVRERPETTHVIIEAPWIEAAAMAKLAAEHPSIEWVVRSHSQIGFLQVEPGAIKLLRELLVLQESMLNLRVAANSEHLRRFFEKVYAAKCLYLPNLYDVERVERKRDVAHDHRKLRVASFGALRWLKNHTTAAAAALMVAKQRQCDLEFWISVNREENGRGILDALRNMFAGLPWAKLIEHPWSDWPDFRRVVAHMDVAFQLSHTETFNIVTADAVAEGVPCVVAPAIEWVPDYWKVDGDRVEDVARVAGHLLSSIDATDDGRAALTRFVRSASDAWRSYLSDRVYPPNPA